MGNPREESSSGVGPSIASPTTVRRAPWTPSGSVFRSYSHSPSGGRQQGQGGLSAMVKGLRVTVSPPIVVKMTVAITETYRTCNPSFAYSNVSIPKRFLTNPSLATSNDGHDNENCDLILCVDGVILNSDLNHSYIVTDILGQGVFGQVAKCWSTENNCFVAVKVIKNDPAYYRQAQVEISILNMLNHKFDPDDQHHIVRIFDHFVFHGHLCIVFEMLGVNLYELLKFNSLRGISLKLIRLFTKQLLAALTVLHEASVIHCDLKLENILLTTSVQCPGIKLIDYGSACMESRTVYSYIQSRFYRSPEVLLGHPYTASIDMWSFGCVAAELFLGLPLFPGASSYDVLQRMIEILGNQPPDHLLRKAKNTSKYFKHAGSPAFQDDNPFSGTYSAFKFLTLSEYEAREKQKPAIGKQYFPGSLEDIIKNYPVKRASSEDLEKEKMQRLAFIDFLTGVLEFDPQKRWTPLQAAQHPFITEKHFDGPFRPPDDTHRKPVYQGFSVDHNPGTGHWLAAGLSPQVQVSGFNTMLQNGSPHHQFSSYASSYGSVGSYGSFGEHSGLGSSFGSCVNNGPAGVFTAYQQAPPPVLGNAGYSPETRKRVGQKASFPMVHSHLGMSPSSNLYRPPPMSLGASPSQFTPPGSSQFQASPGGSASTGSSARFGPSSPARGGGGGGALGKAAAVGQYHKRRSWGSPGSAVSGQSNSSTLQVDPVANVAAESVAGSSCLTDASSPQISPRKIGPHQRKQSATSVPPPPFKSFGPGSLGELLSSSEIVSDAGDDTLPLPDPADWDPNYSEEQLLGNEGGDFTSPIGLKSAPRSPRATGSGGGGRSQQGAPSSSRRNHFPIQGDSMNSLRMNGLTQGLAELSLQSLHGVQSAALGRNAYMPPSHPGYHTVQQISPSRLGQLPGQMIDQALHQYYPSNLQSPDRIDILPPTQHPSTNYYHAQSLQPPFTNLTTLQLGAQYVVNSQSGHIGSGLLPSPRRDNWGESSWVPSMGNSELSGGVVYDSFSQLGTGGGRGFPGLMNQVRHPSFHPTAGWVSQGRMNAFPDRHTVWRS